MSDPMSVTTLLCDEKMKALNDRIGRVEDVADEIRNLTVSVERLTFTIQHMVTEQNDQKVRIAELEARDGDMWRSLVKYAITAVVGLVIGYALKNIGF